MAQLLTQIHRCLESGKLADSLSHLFLEVLGWGAPRGAAPQPLAVGAPVGRELVAVPIANLAGFPVLRIDWPEARLPSLTARRGVHRALLRTHLEHLACYVTQDGLQVAFVWARRPSGRDQDASRSRWELRTLSYQRGSAARTTVERLERLGFTLDELARGEPPLHEVTARLGDAFSVEQVTDAFFSDYKEVFANLQSLLRRARVDAVVAHDYALQLLNRLMLLYFVQRKGWLGGDPAFMRHFWDAYRSADGPRDTFLSHWLEVLFFEAFQRHFNSGRSDRRHFPPEIRDALACAPYLDGALFTRNRLDEACRVPIPDAFFATLFERFEGSEPGFLERYNFTIAESTPFDIEVAVDPEMIGKVYESLVNITAEGLADVDRRGSAGIFYTPRVEIDLMCRLALADCLATHLGQEHRDRLYEAVFAYEPEDKEQADAALARENLWPRLNEALRSLTICDPACGSGSFLVGMLMVLDDLQARAAAQLGIEETAYERRRRIIGEQLYGVDVMGWAVHVAELRLWLQLVIETELKPGELLLRPLLPNLSFKLRQGDSLVQEVGGISFGLHRTRVDIPTPLKGKVTQLKAKKLRFYQGDLGLSEESLRREEEQLFREILRERERALEREIRRLNNLIQSPPEQIDLPGMETPRQERLGLEEKWREQREEKEAELEQVRQALEALRTPGGLPFIWDVAFVEVFEGEKGGFDIVIGNPPYVRQERIEDPQGQLGAVAYKERLQEAAWLAFPHFFGYRPDRELSRTNPRRRLNGRCDLYVYFYLQGLSLLNAKGSFCFITSNSWLDVAYGRDLQELLLRHGHVRMIIDNQARRSFASADVNTIIALLGPVDDGTEGGLGRTARFVSFRVPFEEVLSPVVFEEIEEAKAHRHTCEYRAIVRPQAELLQEGLEVPEEEEGGRPADTLRKAARYGGSKWGGRYLRAPDIFFTLLEKGKGKLVRLGDVAEVRFGIKTGANEFFYLQPIGMTVAEVAALAERDPMAPVGVRNGAGWEGEIEAAFLRPILLSLREARRMRPCIADLHHCAFACDLPREELRRRRFRGALAYVDHLAGRRIALKHGGACRLPDVPSLRGREPWYALPEQQRPDAVANRFVGERFIFVEGGEYLASDTFFVLYGTPRVRETLLAVLNSTVVALSADVVARKTYGVGVAYLYGPEVRGLVVPAVPPVPTGLSDRLLKALGRLAKREVRSIFEELGFPLCRARGCTHPEHPYEHVHPEQASLDRVLPDRRELDEVVFDILGLSEAERVAVYRAVVELVKGRLVKARSV
ncbi:MAG: Eco57I restriction-modification methylase domain-containing protein [Anaerolineae bacterium]|nr:Eco57I restriction-modification methylase domain-containing protein [Anaerolineae bacterium]